MDQTQKYKPSCSQPHRGRLLGITVLLSIATATAGCGSESDQVYDKQARADDANCKDPSTIGELDPPLEQHFEDQGLIIDYERAAPYHSAREDGDGPYTKDIFLRSKTS